MGEKLIDILIEWIEWIKPFYMMSEFDKGVLLRFGKYKKTLESGLHFKVPFIDEVLSRTVVLTTTSLPSQSLTTIDGKDIVVQSIIKYEISDVKINLLEVTDVTDGLVDNTMAIIKKVITERTKDECLRNDLDDIITKKSRHESKKWGIYVHSVNLVSISSIRSYRVFGDTRIE